MAPTKTVTKKAFFNSCSQSSINARIKYRNKACQLFNTSTEAKALILPENFATERSKLLIYEYQNE